MCDPSGLEGPFVLRAKGNPYIPLLPAWSPARPWGGWVVEIQTPPLEKLAATVSAGGELYTQPTLHTADSAGNCMLMMAERTYCVRKLAKIRGFGKSLFFWKIFAFFANSTDLEKSITKKKHRWVRSDFADAVADGGGAGHGKGNRDEDEITGGGLAELSDLNH